MKLVFIKSMLVIFFGTFLLLSSCAKKNSSSQSRAGIAPRGDAAATTTQTLGVNKCANGSSSAGRIFSDTMTGSLFRNAWADFFSAIFAENQMGELNGSSTSTNQGVNLEIKMKIVNNQLVLNETKLNIEVQDSLVGQKNADTGEIYTAIKMSFSSAKSGSLSGQNIAGGSGQFNLTFGDSYGDISLSGTYNQTTSTGTVTFANSKHYNNETPKSGNLGNFSQNSCGLFY